VSFELVKSSASTDLTRQYDAMLEASMAGQSISTGHPLLVTDEDL